MLVGFLAFATPLQAPWWHIVAIAFGIGVGFTLDEFALRVRLEDVYWSKEGRVLLGVTGLFVPVVALLGAVRLAHPSSPWARWRYRGLRLERARARFDPSRRAGRWQRRIGDLVAGAPAPEGGAVVAPRPAGEDDPYG